MSVVDNYRKKTSKQTSRCRKMYELPKESTSSTDCNVDFASYSVESGGSKMPMKHIDVSEKNSIIQDVGSGEVEEEPCYADTLNLLRQTRDGGYVRMKGINIETSPDAVKSQVDTLYFWDGLRKIDIVLAFEEGQEDKEEEEEKIQKRNTFLRNLDTQGLHLEMEPSRNSADGKTSFVKISAPDEILQKYARILNLQIPTKKYNIISYDSNMELIESMEGEDDRKDRRGTGFFSIFDYDQTLIPPEPNFFSEGISLDLADKFIDKIPGDFFTSAQRSMIVWEILMRTPYDDEHKDKAGILRLLSGGVFEAAYPLHDGRYDREGPEGEDGSTRQILHREWARFGCWYKKQPFSLIKRYFGDKIGLYFCWLGFYTKMLILPAIVGLFVFLYGAATVKSDENYPTEEICDEKNMGDTVMCPQCDQNCPFWKLKQSCFLSKITYMFDNTATVTFTIFMSFWATMFLEIWKRRQSVISWEWDLRDFEDFQHTRPEFEAKVKTTRINPVTKQHEPFLSPYNKALRVIFTNSFVLVLLIMVLMAMFSVMLYRVAVIVSMYETTKGTVLSPYASLITSMTASVINLITIVILNYFYEYVALWLTNLEYPRTQTDFEDSFTLKKFLFQFINFYSSLFYIAFFKGKFFSSPGDKDLNTSVFSRFKSDVCDPAGCIYELCIQLAIIMVGKQWFNNFIELLYPKLVVWWKRYVYHSSSVGTDQQKEVYTRWEQDYNLQDVDRLECLNEYLEMVIQYGFVTLFVAAFPLAPFFALLNNIFEIRLDSYKYIATKRRPLAERAQDIGAWFSILQVITYLSVVTNALTIALASDFVPHLVYMYGYAGKSNFTLKGFVSFTLTPFNTSLWGDPYNDTWQGPSDNRSYVPEICYFEGHRDGPPDYVLDKDWYFILTAKLIFVLVYEHIVFGMTGLVAVFIPDIPSKVKIQIKRENQLDREAFFEMEFQQAMEKKAAAHNSEESSDKMNVTSIDNVYFKDDSTGLEETSADIRNRHSSYDV